MDTKENGNLIPSQVIYVDDLIKNAISRSLKFTFFCLIIYRIILSLKYMSLNHVFQFIGAVIRQQKQIVLFKARHP
jgi:hypothetical protein